MVGGKSGMKMGRVAKEKKCLEIQKFRNPEEKRIFYIFFEN